MEKIRLIIIITIFTSLKYAECNGFNWYHNINIKDCNEGDIDALNQFIINSKDSLEMDMDTNFNGEIEALELGWQLWENGRLIHWICNDVPSPYYYYEYDCGLSGNIPKEIHKMDALIKLRLQSNNLTGDIPLAICKLNNINSGSYWFNLQNNYLCPPYPQCVEKIINNQNITNCK